MSIFYTGLPDQDRGDLTPAQKAEAAEGTLCVALIGLPELALPWQAKTEAEARRNRRLFLVASLRNDAHYMMKHVAKEICRTLNVKATGPQGPRGPIS